MTNGKKITFRIAEGHEATYTEAYAPARRATNYRFVCSCGHHFGAANMRVYKARESAHYDAVLG